VSPLPFADPLSIGEAPHHFESHPRAPACYHVRSLKSQYEDSAPPGRAGRRTCSDRWQDAAEATQTITDELLATAPITVAGIVAALEHWADVAEDTDDLDFGRTIEFIQHIAEAVGRLAHGRCGGVV
jgi:hypothetical protein